MSFTNDFSLCCYSNLTNSKSNHKKLDSHRIHSGCINISQGQFMCCLLHLVDEQAGISLIVVDILTFFYFLVLKFNLTCNCSSFIPIRIPEAQI